MTPSSRESLVFLSGKRTPFGANGGKLRQIEPSDLGAAASIAAMEQARVGPHQIDHVIFGSVLHSSSESVGLSRYIELKSKIPQHIPALTINRLCGSGFQVIVEAYQQMLAGDTKIALVGGVENMSMTPFALRNARWGMRLGHGTLHDMLQEGLTDSFAKVTMAITAENLAEMYKISKQEADTFALRSQTLAKEAKAAGRFNEEIVPLKELQEDEHPRPESTMESLTKLKALFKENGTVSAGNASGIVDGAAAMVVATASEANRLGLKPLGRLISYGIVGCDPKIMGIGPAPAAKIALERAKMNLSQMDLIEVNEAFAPQALAVAKELQIPMDKMNVNGGAIAIGHPLAASGTRIMMHLLYELKRRKARYALGSACIGGGQGIALIVEAL